MTSWAPPTELKQAVPRPTKMAGGFIFICLVMFFQIMFQGAMFYSIAVPAYSLKHLKDTGGHADGRIINLSSRYIGGKAAHTNYYLAYQYQLTGKTYQGSAQVFSSDYQNVKVGQAVTVIYRQSSPEVSTLPIAITQSTSPVDPPGFPGLHAYGVLAILVTVLTLITVYLVRRYSRERNLITSGCAAQGTVLSMKHFKTRNGQYIKLTYTFTDNMGQIVEGKSNVGAQSIDANNVTILYDPGDSSRNAAYPMQFAKCQQSETLYGS